MPPCAIPPPEAPLVAWDPRSGGVVDDVSAFNRDATVDGAAEYDGTRLVLNGQMFLRTAPTALGFLRDGERIGSAQVPSTGSTAAPPGNSGSAPTNVTSGDRVTAPSHHPPEIRTIRWDATSTFNSGEADWAD